MDTVHFSSKTSEHYTPGHIVDAVLAALESIDLDPCADPGRSIPARRHYTRAEDGLSRPWFGNVYMNPPYGRAISAWVERLDLYVTLGEVQNAIALVPARTDTAWWHTLVRRSTALCCIRGRLTFGDAPYPAPFPSALVHFGHDTHDSFVYAFRHLGNLYQLVDVREPVMV